MWQRYKILCSWQYLIPQPLDWESSVLPLCQMVTHKKTSSKLLHTLSHFSQMNFCHTPFSPIQVVYLSLPHATCKFASDHIFMHIYRNIIFKNISTINSYLAKNNNCSNIIIKLLQSRNVANMLPQYLPQLLN